MSGYIKDYKCEECSGDLIVIAGCKCIKEKVICSNCGETPTKHYMEVNEK